MYVSTYSSENTRLRLLRGDISVCGVCVGGWHRESDKATDDVCKHIVFYAIIIVARFS